MLRYFSVIVSQYFLHQHQQSFLVKSNANLSLFFHFIYCFLFLFLNRNYNESFHDYSWVSWIEHVRSSTSHRRPYQLLNKTSSSFGETKTRSSSPKHFLLPIVQPIGLVSFSILTSILLPESEFSFQSATQKVVITVATCIFSSVFLLCCFSIWLLAHQFLPPYSL